MKKQFVFSEANEFRNQLEIKHIRKKNHYVLAIILFMMMTYLVYMLLSGYSLEKTLPLMLGFASVLMFNIANLAYGQDHPEFFHINKYVTTIGIFSISIAIIFLFKSPSMVIGLFIAYAVSAFYQDVKVLTISNVSMLVTVLMIVLNYPEYLGLENASLDLRFGIGFFFVIFIMMLSVASYIIIKQKSFFFNQISSSHEMEFRNLDLLIDLKKKHHEKHESIEFYFDALNEFSEAFSQKIETPNVFKEKIELLRQLANHVPKDQILKQYPMYQIEDLDRLEDLLTTEHHKLRKIAMKISYSYQMDIKKREMFSETQFKSFNHATDNIEIKIVAFVLFYTVLKKGYGILRSLSEDEIYQALTQSDFYYYLEPRITKIYEENHEVFDKIVEDAFGKKVRK